MEDFEFSTTVLCAKYGMGSFTECLAHPLETRLAYFYVVALSLGLKVDWQTGRTYRPET